MENESLRVIKQRNISRFGQLMITILFFLFAFDSLYH